MREKVDKKNKFPDFPLKPEKGKIRLFIENFRVREKVDYLSKISVGKKKQYI